MDLNLLLIGGTGSGKSFFINAFERLVVHRSLDDAAEHLDDFAAPIVFYHNDVQIREPVAEEYLANSKSASSQTRRPVVYEYQTKSGTVRLIDTPGIGDTEGEAVDETHMAHIVSCVRGFDKIHGILLFFKKSDNRFGETHKKDLLKLLSFLGKTAMVSVQVVITHADPLHELTEVPSVVNDLNRCLLVNIPNGAENTFFFQNSFIKYLVLNKQGRNPFSERACRIFAEDYKESARECARMLAKICSNKMPYEVSQYKTLAMVRQLRASLQGLFSDAHNRDELRGIARQTAIIKGLQEAKARLENDLENVNTYFGDFSNYMRNLPKRLTGGSTVSSSAEGVPIMDAGAAREDVTSAFRSNVGLNNASVDYGTNAPPILLPEPAPNASNRNTGGDMGFAAYNAYKQYQGYICTALPIVGSTLLSSGSNSDQQRSESSRPKSSPRTSRDHSSTNNRSGSPDGDSLAHTFDSLRSIRVPSRQTLTGPVALAGAAVVGIAALAVGGTLAVTNYRDTNKKRAEFRAEIQRMAAQIDYHLNIVKRLEARLREKEDICQLEKDLDRFMFDDAILASERSSQAEIQITAPFSWQLLNNRIVDLQELPIYGDPISRALSAFERENAVEFDRVTLRDITRGYMFDEIYASC